VKLLTESGEQNAQVMRDERGSVIRIPFAEVCVLDLPAGGTGG